MNTRTLAAAVVLAAVSCAAASAQTALNELRAAAGPAAVGESIKIGDVVIGIKIGDRQRQPYGWELCGKIPFDGDRNVCLDRVAQARFLDRGAVGICEKLSFWSNVTNCVSAIADKEYLDSEIAMCGRESFDDGKVNCLSASGRSTWGSPRNDPRDGREEAARACGKADFESDRAECIRIVGRAWFFDPAATAVCASITFSENFPKCFAAIADKEYFPPVAAECGRESFDDGKVSCLAASGRSPRRRERWRR